ncbi:MAG TPA: trypsin-like peptidase domain-containing protein [Dactylosporangium sp.]|jgi:S1-C subfamily serine protease|nr:trypsin-like peptidase domain-containing protein [Dactylosporangium sp.]
MPEPHFAYGVAVAPGSAPVTAVPATAVPAGDGADWYGPERWGGWDGPVPPPRPPHWHRPPGWDEPPARPARRLLRWIVGIAAITGLALLVAAAGLAAIVGSRNPAPRASATAQANAAAPVPPGGILGESAEASSEASPTPTRALSTQEIVSTVNKSVVNITSTLGLRNTRVAGTGVVVGNGGLVITNNHVIAGATAISGVAVANGRTFQATVVGYDRSHDIALIQLAGASNLPRLGVADSSQVKAGDPIVAVGNAGGQGGTPDAVTGSVTALNRSINAQDPDGGGSRRLDGLIEVAADIKAGDSGGPLVDRAGRLIGINTAASIDPRDQSPAGQGFAVPSNTALGIAGRIQSGKASSTIHIGATALLGVAASDAGGRTQGAEVTGVVSGSPADRAGLENGDVIRSVDGQEIGSAADLTSAIDLHHPGDEVRVVWVDRSGRTRSATVRLATGPAG